MLEVDFNAPLLPDAVLAQLTSEATRPTAIFCSNDLLAMVVMRGLRGAQFSVPDDFSVLGFDGLAIGELLAPSLASVASPNREIGRSAWRRLAERLAGETHEKPALTLPHTVRDGGWIATLPGTPTAKLPRRETDANADANAGGKAPGSAAPNA